MLVQEGKRALAVNFVLALEELDFSPARNLQVRIQDADAGVFVGDPFIQAYPIVVAALHHERPGRDQPCHLCIIIGVGQVELVHIVFVAEHVAAAPEQGDVLPDPLVEIARANDGAVPAQQRPDAHGHLAAVGQAIIRDAVAVHKGQGLEPVENPSVLGHDERVER